MALPGLIYINLLNVTTSVKNNRNNVLVYLILLVFKTVLTATLLINIINVFNTSKELYISLDNSNTISNLDLYELNITNYTSSKVNKELIAYISNISSGVYKYKYCPDEDIDKDYIINTNDSNDLYLHSIEASANLLPKLNIKDINNKN